MAIDSSIYTYDTSGDSPTYRMLTTGLGLVRDIFANAMGDLLISTSTRVVWLHNLEVVNITNTSTSTNTSTNSIATAGSRVWIVVDGTLQELMLPLEYKRCAAGFIAVGQLCMQVGYGHYSYDGMSMQECPPGTFGIAAGSPTQSLACQKCGAGSVAPVYGSLMCTLCIGDQVASSDSTLCLDDCDTGAYMSKGICTACPSGYITGGSSSCSPCPANTYVNASTGGLCLACGSGMTSPIGAHHCVRKCSEGQCSSDGRSCIDVDAKYSMLTQTTVTTNVLVTAVLSNGGVFFSDRLNVYYYLDDCTPEDGKCARSGSKLLPDDPLTPDMGGRDIWSMAIANMLYVTPSLYRYLYIGFWNNQTIYRLTVYFPAGDGAADTQKTLEMGVLPLFATVLHFTNVRQCSPLFAIFIC